MSNMKNGFSTLNRWLGKKNKEKSPAPNGKLSKSNTNLSISTTNISDTSQLEYNRIAPLPAITSNAPFEQTFRITVLLPKDQLYVARLGARVPLNKLLELACDHKSLDPEKYEFRNPVDASQVYSCDLTIGAVGLSEIRLCNKSDSYDSFNADEVMKLHRTSIIRDSLSSSEFSSRNSKHTTKTASPYSSSNSLNSMDSTGMNYTRTPVAPPPALPKTAPPNVLAPPRKKRAAPRPPSQIVIPEKAALVIEQEAATTEQTIETLKQQQKAMSSTARKNFYASTPNLTTNADSNGNATTTREVIENGIGGGGGGGGSTSTNGIIVTNGNTIEYSDSEYAQIVKKNARNLHGGSMQSLPSELPTSTSTDGIQLPEPSPRKRLTLLKKKAAPAPPPRGSSISCSDDISPAASTTTTPPSTPSTPNTIESIEEITIKEQTIAEPEPLAREKSQQLQASTPKAKLNIPTPVPRQTTTTLLNATTTTAIQLQTNVSKVLLNRSPTPEPRSLASESSETADHLIANDNDDNISKQADSGIGDLVPSPIPDSLPSEGSTHECKSTFESSSDDDEIIKTYNFKLGKTIVKGTDDLDHPTALPQSLDELRSLQVVDSAEATPAPLTNEKTPNISSPSSWNFAIPISPPPTFADQNANHLESSSTDAPITPKIVERPVLKFEKLSSEKKDVVDHSSAPPITEASIEKSHRRSTIGSPTSPINEIIEELSTILNENRVDTLIKRHDEQHEIKSAKPNTLTNFTISTITTQQQQQQITSTTTTTTEPPTDAQARPDSTTTDEEKLYKKRGSITNGIDGGKRKSVTRADSFHTTSSNVNGVSTQSSTIITSTTKTTESTTNGLNSRSASYLSLSKLDQNGGLNQRRSSSELSIGESPSLQSLEVIKTILNSRKNSLVNSGDIESKAPNVDIISVERNRTVTEESTKISNAESKQPKVNPTETAAAATKSTTKEPPKIYRYSGPPSINFSTWSERPKVQVQAIKNEGDYIFGGKNAGNQNAAVTRADVELRNTQTVPPRQQQAQQKRATMHVLNRESTKSPPLVAPKPTYYSTTERMGIPEKDFHVPVTVKPLKDVTIENVELRTTSNVSKVMLNASSSATTSTSRPTSTSTSMSKKPPYAQVSNTSTLPRAGHNNTNRFSIPAKQSIGVNLLRSTSITQLEQRNSTIQNDATTATNAAPFGQNTLRKTGLKEKILAKEDQTTLNQQNEEQIPKSNFNTNNIIQIETRSTVRNGTFAKPLRAKMELKLQDPAMQVSIKQNGGTIMPHTPIASTPKSAPPAPVPPVPPMSILKSVTLRSQSASTATTPTSGDQRDALLDAIRNFKRTDLSPV